MKFFQNLVWVAIFLLSGTVAAQTPVYLDETKPMEDRIEDALSRMTLEEKVSQTGRSAPAIKRLGVRVERCTIYSFSLGKEIPVPLEAARGE